jgi:mitochondrial fission protein ELM1
MISEAAVTGKPIYIAMMKSNNISRRFKNFYTEFNNLGITKELNDSIENWSYNKLDEVNRLAPIIRKKMKSNGII